MNDHRKEKNWLEWTVFAIGLLLVTSLVGYLIYDLWTAQSGPPRVQVQLGPPEPRSDHYVVPVVVTNRGQQTAEQVHVEVRLTRSDGRTEKASFDVPFLPRDATRQGTVTFESDPRTAEDLTARALGYRRP